MSTAAICVVFFGVFATGVLPGKRGHARFMVPSGERGRAQSGTKDGGNATPCNPGERACAGRDS
ncbi:hypothetical protein STXM2123_5866 [Streptomyces sp. F-3]|nr:hypothetical protein STXM2123_5866 [Streptomyces sp. F-3]